MTKKVLCGKVPGNRIEILRLLGKHNKTGVPIVKDDDLSYVGFVTRQDLYAKPDEEQTAMLMRKDHPALNVNDDIVKAAKLFVKHSIHHLPVLGGKRKVVGIVTPADLLLIIERRKINRPVCDFLKSVCIPTYEGTPLQVANTIMEICNVTALPVLDKRGRLCGIVTDRDIFNLSIFDEKTSISGLGFGVDDDIWTWEGLRNIMKLHYQIARLRLPDVPVKSVMVKKPMSVFKKTSISDAAKIMREYDFGQLPVRDEKDRLLGMLYELDVMNALL
jgi:CBS domain-containing protein